MSRRRTTRVNGLLRDELSQLLQRELKDPRIHGVVSITEVDISPDLKHARVFISILGEAQDKRDVLQGLRSAAGFLRHQLKGRLDMRYIPDLSFVLDESLERGAHLSQLIREVREETGPGESG